MRGIDTSSIKGRTVIEMGCGMGKYVKTVARHAALAVGLDLSHSLERARENTRGLTNVLLVQGNILEPPFRPGTFDYVYSVGVLHHTPDCRLAFKRSAALVAPGGRFSVWLYPTERQSGLYARAVHFVQDRVIRPVTCRLPPAWLYQVCRLLGRMTYWRDAAAADGRIALAKFYALFAVGGHPEPKIAEFLNFDWYSPQYRSYHSEEELLRWFAEEGLGNMRILPMRTSGIADKPQAGATLPPHAPAGICGAIDHPRGEAAVVAGDELLVQGWAFDASGHSVDIEILVDGIKVRELQCFEARVDVKRAYPDFAHALYCGFHCFIPAQRSWAPEIRVTVVAKSSVCVPVTIGEHRVKVTRLPLAQQAARRWRRWFPRNAPDGRREAERALYRTWMSLYERDVPRPHRSDPADPLISIVVPVHETPAAFLRELLASIAAQTSDRWQLCAVDDGSASPEPWRVLQEFAAQHPDRVVLKRREQAGGIAVASNDAIAMASGDYIAFCDHDDVLRSDAVAILSETIRANPGVDVVYSDHDILEPDGGRAEPRLKPGWSPDLLRSYMYWGHIKCYRAGLVRELHGLRAEFRGAEDYDLALRAAERTQRIVHVPEVLYHWRRHEQSTSSGGTQKAYSIHSGLAALQEHLVPLGDRGGCELAGAFAQRRRRRVPARLPLCRVAVDRRRHPHARPPRAPFPLRVDAGSHYRLPGARNHHRRQRQRAAGDARVSARHAPPRASLAGSVQFLRADEHRGAADKRGISALPQQRHRDRRGGLAEAHGRLCAPSRRRRRGRQASVPGWANPASRRRDGPRSADRPLLPGREERSGRSSVPCATSARSAMWQRSPPPACSRRGSCSSKRAASTRWSCASPGTTSTTACGCLRKGYRVIVDPDVVVIHHEGVSRGDEKNEREIATMFGRWRELIEADPFYHPGFARTGRSFALRGEPAEAEFRRLHYARYAREADGAAAATTAMAAGRRAT